MKEEEEEEKEREEGILSDLLQRLVSLDALTGASEVSLSPS